MRNALAALLIILASAAHVPAADNAPFDLAPLLQELIEKHEVPGASAAIVHGDKMVALGSAGVRKLNHPARFEVTDSVHLGSDTKAMTALLIGQLVDRKQLAFDAPLSQLFPDLAETMNAEMAGVTVRDLLDHTAGLPTNLDFQAIARTQAELAEQRRQVVAQALAQPPNSQIGKYAYSNVGYVILGAIVESKAAQPWEAVIEREIFKPLGMTTAGFGPPGTRGQVDQPWGHSRVGKYTVPVQLDHPRVIGPAGLVHCSMGDWSKFISETLRGARGRPRLVSAETFRQLTTPLAGREYAGGWITAEHSWAQGLSMMHAGSDGAWYCLAWLAPQRDVAVLIALNCGLGDVDKIAHEGALRLIAEYDRFERGE